jgi:hypothetical protein
MLLNIVAAVFIVFCISTVVGLVLGRFLDDGED